MSRVLSFCFLLVLFAASRPHAATTEVEDLRDVEAAALAFARAQTSTLPGRVEIAGGRPDPTMQLPRCDRLQPFLPPNGRLWGRSLVAVRCSEPVQWVVQVPVTVQVYAAVVVTARPVGRNQILSEGDVTQQEMELTRLPLGVVTGLDDAVGRRSITALPAGTALRPDMLKAPPVVLQGQPVQLIYKGEGFRVNGEGRSLSDAAIGDRAQVRTPSGKVLRGIVIEKGVVQVQ